MTDKTKLEQAISEALEVWFDMKMKAVDDFWQALGDGIRPAILNNLLPLPNVTKMISDYVIAIIDAVDAFSSTWSAAGSVAAIAFVKEIVMKRMVNGKRKVMTQEQAVDFAFDWVAKSAMAWAVSPVPDKVMLGISLQSVATKLTKSWNLTGIVGMVVKAAVKSMVLAVYRGAVTIVASGIIIQMATDLVDDEADLPARLPALSQDHPRRWEKVTIHRRL